MNFFRAERELNMGRISALDIKDFLKKVRRKSF